MKKILFMCLISVVLFDLHESSMAVADNAVFSKEMLSRNQLEEQGISLAEAGKYHEAELAFKMAPSPQLIEAEDQKGFAKAWLIRVLKIQGRYEEALNEGLWFVEQSEFNSRKYGFKNADAELQIKEILALKKYQETGDSSEVNNYLKEYMNEKRKLLPPTFEWGLGSVECSTIIRLYHSIGDLDAGVRFSESMIAHLYQNIDADGASVNPVQTSREALDLSAHHKKDKNDSLSRFYELLSDFLRIREGFESDKAEGFTGCAGKIPGEECVGNAMRALIKSEYLPW